MKIFSFRISMYCCIAALFLSLGSALLQAQDINQALKYLQSERYEDADAIFQKLIDSNPTEANACFYYGESVLTNFQNDQYSNTLEEVVKESGKYFNMGIKRDSTNMLNYIGLGILKLLQHNDTIGADVYFTKVENTIQKKEKKFTDNDFNLLVKLAMAQLYSPKPRYNKAIAYLERAKAASVIIAQKTKKEVPAVYMALGDIYNEMNNASLAVSNYNKAVYIDDKLYEPIVKIGRLYMRSRNLQEARNYFDQAKEIDSTYAPLYRAYGEMYAMGGLANLSKQNFKKFLDLSGNNIPAKIQYVNSLFKAKDYKTCVENIEEIFAVDKSRNYLNRLAAYSCYEMRPADYDKAKMFIEEFFKNSTPEKIIPKDYTYYGRTLLKMKDTALTMKAFEQLQKAYSFDTTDFALLSDIAVNAYYAKQFKLAVETFNKKIALGQAETSDYFTLGKTYYQMAQSEKDTAIQRVDYNDAIKTFTIITKNEPSNVEAYLWIANTSFGLDPESKLGIAKPAYEMVIEKGNADSVKYAPQLFAAYSYMGSFYLFAAKPDYAMAESIFWKMVWLDPKKKDWQVKGYYSLGATYTSRKNYTVAQTYYKKVLEIDPKNEAALKDLESINKVLKAKQNQ